jgi:hypothetical protein
MGRALVYNWKRDGGFAEVHHDLRCHAPLDGVSAVHVDVEEGSVRLLDKRFAHLPIYINDQMCSPETREQLAQGRPYLVGAD